MSKKTKEEKQDREYKILRSGACSVLQRFLIVKVEALVLIIEMLVAYSPKIKGKHTHVYICMDNI